MKKLLTILFLSLLAFIGKAQLSAEFYVKTDYSLWFSKSKDIANFFTTYNSYQAAHPEAGGVSPFKTKTGSMNGLIYGAGLRILFNKNGYFDFSLNGSKFASAANSFTFNNGDAREVKITSRDFIFDIGFGFGHKLCFGGNINLSVQNSAVATGYRFANGTITYGDAYSLNGVYSSNRLGFYYGLEASYRIVKFLRLAFGIGHYGTMLPADKFYFEEQSGPKMNSTDIHTYLPHDYGKYVADPITGSDNTAINNLRGMRMTFGVRLLIPTKER